VSVGGELVSPTSYSVPNPTGATTGDVLVALVGAHNMAAGNATAPTLTGWTQLIGSSVAMDRFEVWYRDWTSGSFSIGKGANDWGGATIFAIQGATKIGITNGSAATGSASTTVSPGGVTAADGDVLISALYAWDGYTMADLGITYPSGMTPRTLSGASDYADLGGGGFASLYLASASSDNLSAGATGSRSWTLADDYSSSIYIARNILVPAATEAPPSVKGWGIVKVGA
jgi:hypothetical protein